MKKLTVSVLALLCALALGGCAAEKQPPALSTPTPFPESTPAPESPAPDGAPDTDSKTPDSEIPGGTRFILEIRDRAAEENLACDMAEEVFYDDGVLEYYFGVIKSHYVTVTYNNANSEDIATALRAGRATLADLDSFGIEYRARPKSDALDAAIADAVSDHFRSGDPDGLIHAESHMLLASETVSGTPKLGENDHTEKLTVYLLVHHMKYRVSGGDLEAVDGSFVPAAITFAVGSDGEYRPEEYWQPRDGSDYADDIRARFSADAAKTALNAQDYVGELEVQTHNKAMAYLSRIGIADATAEAGMAAEK